MASNTQLDALTRIIEAVMPHRDLEGFHEALGEIIKDEFPEVDDFGLARYDADRHQFIVVAAHESSGRETNLGAKTKDTEDTPGGFLMKMKRTVIINDFDAFRSQSGHDFQSLFPRSFESGIGTLLEHGGKVLGYVYLTSTKKNTFDDKHRDFLDLGRNVISLAFDNAITVDSLTRLKDQAELEGEYLRSEIRDNWPDDGLIGTSEAWKDVLVQVGQVARTDSTVLIQGETGTGKEVIARAIHERSLRAKKPLIKINCGALPENLVESELFGHERGSFTGAMGRRIGRFELANGGTIFLDEIGEMPLSLQVKLLRVLQEREFERVGGEKPIRVDVRVITATNRDLSAEVAAGRFRADLYYRLNVFPVAVPPLRMRPEDAVELARYFLDRTTRRMGKTSVAYSDDSIQAIQNYSWPGNVRELEHLVERAVILATRREADIKSLLMPNPASMAFPAPGTPVPTSAAVEVASGKNVSLRDRFEEAEREAIEAALRESKGVVGGKNGAAARLGLKRQTLQSKIKKLGIDPDELLATAG